MQNRMIIGIVALFISWGADPAVGRDKPLADGWRTLPLIKEEKVDPNWVHIGYGKFVVEDGSLRTECDEKGLGLLLYRKEKFGNCQIRVVYKSKDAKSNAGIYVRIDDGIVKQVNKKHPPASPDYSLARIIQ